MPKQKVWTKVSGGFKGIGEMHGFYIAKHAKLTPREVRDLNARGLDPSKQPKYTLWDQSHHRRKVVSGSLALVRLVAKNIVEYENRKAQGLPPLDKPIIPLSHAIRKNRTNPKRKSQAQKKAQSNAKKAMKIANSRGISLKQAWKIVKSKSNPNMKGYAKSNPRRRKNSFSQFDPTEKRLPCKFTKLELEIFDDVGGSYMDHIEDEFGTSPTNKVHSLNDIEFFHVIINERSNEVERMRSAYAVNGLPFGMKPPSQNYLNRLYRLEAKLEKCIKKF